MQYHARMLVGTGVGLMLLAGCSGKTDPAGGNASTAAAPALATTSPRKPKPGLWAMTVTAPGMPNAMTMRSCIGATAPGGSSFTPPPPPGQTCAKRSVVPTATGYAIDTECSGNGVTVAIRGTVSGDFSTSFRTDLVTRMSAPGMPATAEGAKSSVEAKYVGACPADMKPGETRHG